MKNILFTAAFILITVFSVDAQTSEQIYSSASKEVKAKMDENKQNGKIPLDGITAKHIFKVSGPINKDISDVDVHIVEAPGMVNYAINLNTDWSKIRSLEFECKAAFSLEEIRVYFQEVEITIVKDKVSYSLL